MVAPIAPHRAHLDGQLQKGRSTLLNPWEPIIWRRGGSAIRLTAVNVIG